MDKVKKHKNHIELQITVSESFKGITEKNITVSEDMTWGTSKVGESYLFFLMRQENGWHNQLCSPTTTLNNANEELEYLQPQALPLKNEMISSSVNTNDISRATTNEDGALNNNTSWTHWIVVGCIAASLVGCAAIVLLSRSRASHRKKR
ncbi:hypothetical protein M3231_23705 [Neobacillus mesonae]|nr:hypothetical protein [Neobacillus mesonae]